jgi:hypothetical protein
MRRFVFICHASEDAGTAAAIVESLEQRGIRCWMAPRDVPLGAQYAQAIVAGISGADALVLLFSDHANRSPHVPREAERAVSRGVPIFPVRVSDDEPSAALEYFISSAQWLDISTGELEEHLSLLATRLGELIEAGEEPSARMVARDALHQAIARLGPGLADEPRRVEVILRDLAGEHKAEVAAPSVAAAEGVGSALLIALAGMHEGLTEKLTQRLQNNRGLAAVSLHYSSGAI